MKDRMVKPSCGMYWKLHRGVIYAFEYDVTEEMLRNAVMDRSLGKHLYKEEVHKGDLFYVSSWYWRWSIGG